MTAPSAGNRASAVFHKTEIQDSPPQKNEESAQKTLYNRKKYCYNVKAIWACGRFTAVLPVQTGAFCAGVKRLLRECGGVAQLGERTVRIRKVESSILFVSTKEKHHLTGWCFSLACLRSAAQIARLRRVLFKSRENPTKVFPASTPFLAGNERCCIFSVKTRQTSTVILVELWWTFSVPEKRRAIVEWRRFTHESVCRMAHKIMVIHWYSCVFP